MVPAGGVERRSREGVAPRDVRDVGPVELADRRDDRPGRQRALGPVGGPDADRPGRRVSSHVAPSTSVCHRTWDADAVPVHHVVGSTPAARAAGRRTRSSGRSARSCSSRSGCRRRPGRRGSEFSHQVPPTPAFFSIDGERDAGLLQPDRRPAVRTGRTRSRPPGSRPAAAGSPARLDPAGVAAVELHLLEQHRHVLARARLRRPASHHLVEQLGADRRRLGAAAVAVVADDLERERPASALSSSDM